MGSTPQQDPGVRATSPSPLGPRIQAPSPSSLRPRIQTPSPSSQNPRRTISLDTVKPTPR